MDQNQNNKYVIFRMGDEDFGILIDYVQAIERMKSITPIPNTPHYIRGVVYLRGLVIPVVDLRRDLVKDLVKDSNETRILIINAREKTTGFIVDRATEILDIPSDTIQTLSGIGQEKEGLISVARVDERLFILLNMEDLLTEVHPADKLRKVIEKVS